MKVKKILSLYEKKDLFRKVHEAAKKNVAFSSAKDPFRSSHNWEGGHNMLLYLIAYILIEAKVFSMGEETKPYLGRKRDKTWGFYYKKGLMIADDPKKDNARFKVKVTLIKNYLKFKGIDL